MVILSGTIMRTYFSIFWLWELCQEIKTKYKQTAAGRNGLPSARIDDYYIR